MAFLLFHTVFSQGCIQIFSSWFIEWQIYVAWVLIGVNNKILGPDIGVNTERSERWRSQPQPTLTLLAPQPKRGWALFPPTYVPLVVQTPRLLLLISGLLCPLICRQALFVRVQTTFVGFCFVFILFLLLFLPPQDRISLSIFGWSESCCVDYTEVLILL